jgi:hypothetical protein
MTLFSSRVSPQGLKPVIFELLDGRTEVVPFPNHLPIPNRSPIPNLGN